MRELNFYAYAPGPDGIDQVFSVYKRGSTFEVCGPNFETHTCHPATTTRSKVLGEIGLVYGISITKTEEPSDGASGA